MHFHSARKKIEVVAGYDKIFWRSRWKCRQVISLIMNVSVHKPAFAKLRSNLLTAPDRKVRKGSGQPPSILHLKPDYYQLQNKPFAKHALCMFWSPFTGSRRERARSYSECGLVPRILINLHIRLSDFPYAASSSIGNARIASFGFIAYEQSSCVNVPEIYYSVY